jgi:hypothetical protein
MTPPEHKNSPETKTETTPESVVASEVQKQTAQVQKEVIDTKLSNIKEKQELLSQSNTKMM